ncbi:hypothetical protein ACXIUS_29120 [Bosea thiooxidans]|nr:hypothetical protein [Bosea sp. (in: a-proteobacteria)]
MPTLYRTFKVKEVYAEWERIEEALRPIGVPVDFICFLEEAIDSLAYGKVERAHALGIKARLGYVQEIDPARWLGSPVDVEACYDLPDETQAVLFRTMVL